MQRFICYHRLSFVVFILLRRVCHIGGAAVVILVFLSAYVKRRPRGEAKPAPGAGMGKKRREMCLSAAKGGR